MHLGTLLDLLLDFSQGTKVPLGPIPSRKATEPSQVLKDQRVSQDARVSAPKPNFSLTWRSRSLRIL